MDASLVIDSTRDESAVRNRLDSFRLGALPSARSAPSLSNPGHIRSHSRSHSRNHSRNTSISSFPPPPVAAPLPSSQQAPLASDSSLATFSFPPMEISPTPLPPAANKRNSHHRRHSSVSTRTESAELMGVSLPDLPASSSEANANLGDKDSIRRRALWALEGKPDVSFAKVEIPDISTPNMEKASFDFSPKSTFPSGNGSAYGSSLSSLLGSKRDSFKLLAASSSTKDQLHTLVEEEEEEEEEDQVHQVSVPGDEASTPLVVDMLESEAIRETSSVSLPSSIIHTGDSSNEETYATVAAAVPLSSEITVIKPVPSRPRPATLNLRPLSLTPENLVASNHGLPTPSLTPSPRSGLRTLSLSPAPTSVDGGVNQITTPTPASRRPQLNLNLGNCENPFPTPDSEDSRPVRRSSITYKTPSQGVMMGLAGLPTPEMTPTFKDRRFSITDSLWSTKSDDEFFPGGAAQNRPLSASEQHFLVKSHNALLARITDLERTLSVRHRSSYPRSETGSSRPVSISSDATFSDTSSEPSDEMLRLIADLKAERDELKRDVDGWRTRVGDMEKQLTLLTKRVESERRDAWVARSRVGLLEVEKGVVDQKLEGAERAIEALGGEKQALEMEKEILEQERNEMKNKIQELEEEVKLTKLELEKERELRSAQEAVDLLATPTPAAHSSSMARPRSAYGRNKGTAFPSVDTAESSASEIETESLDDCQARFGFMPNVVQGEDDEECEEDNGLAGYEDEDESDVSFCSSSSLDSIHEHPSTSFLSSAPSTPRPCDVVPSAPLDSDSQSRKAMHRPGLSWPATWTFPIVTNTQHHSKQDSVDRFFGCLEDDSSSEDGSVPCSPSQYSFEKSKRLFASALKMADDTESPFFLPEGVGVIVESPEETCLDVVLEENSSDEESDEDMFGEMGGIRITLSPPQPEDDELVEPKQFTVQNIQRPVEKPPQLPMLNFDDREGNSEPFSFGPALDSDDLGEEGPVVPVIISPSREAADSSPPSISRPTSPRSVLPSAIPRPSTFKTAPPVSSLPKASSSSPPPSSSSPPNTYVTPPTKRGGTMPSFIPQPVGSPSPARTAPALVKSKAGTPTFIRQPQRRSLKDNGVGKVTGDVGRGGTSTNGSSLASQISILTVRMNHRDSFTRFSEIEELYSHNYGQQTQIMKSVDFTIPTFRDDQRGEPSLTRQDEHATNVSKAPALTSIITSPFTAKLSSFSNLMPFSWGATSQSPASSSTSDSSIGSLPPDPRLDGPLGRQQPQQNPLRKREYVSRQEQLEKLRKRMEMEGRQQMRALVNLHCRHHPDKTVVL